MKYLILGILTFNSIAYALDWPHSDEKCSFPKKELAIVTEHVTGTNSLSCKLITGDNYESQESMRADYMDCTQDPIAIDSLVLLEETYHEIWDAIGRKKCMKRISLIQVIGKIQN